MPSVHKSVIVPHAARAMFDLVDHCEDYPEFLPWCSGATVAQRTATITRGELEIDFRGFRGRIATVNHKRAPHEIRMELVDGPFESFEGRWKFTSIGEKGSRVELQIDYTFASGVLQALMAPVFGHITETFVDRFVARADEVAS
jgi:ribosome-associated toxin RatA of RatAB toxin-antitoxin module